MADHSGLSLGDWLAVAVTSILAGVGSAMAWFNGEKKALRATMREVQDDMVAWNLEQSAQARTLAVMTEKHVNIEGDLSDIKKYCEKLDNKLDRLSDLVKTKT